MPATDADRGGSDTTESAALLEVQQRVPEWLSESKQEDIRARLRFREVIQTGISSTQATQAHRRMSMWMLCYLLMFTESEMRATRRLTK